MKRIQSHLKQEKLDLAFLTVPDTCITYFCKSEPSHGCFQITPKEAQLYLSVLDKAPVVADLQTYAFNKDTKKNLINSKKIKVGLNYSSLTLAEFENVKKIFPKAEFTNLSPFLSDLREKKNSEEISLIRKACSITSRAFDALLQELTQKKLKTEADVAIFLESYIRNAGASLAFPTIAAMGKNASIPHHVTSNSPLKRGFLLVDFGARWKGYCADMTRMVCLGKITKQEIKLYSLLLEAQQATISQVNSNKNFIELTNFTKEKLGSYAKYFIHSLGHGIGIEVHESPVFSNKTAKVKENVPFTIEPGIYLPGKCGLRIEDTCYFDGKKVIVLTKATKELKIIA